MAGSHRVISQWLAVKSVAEARDFYEALFGWGWEGEPAEGFGVMRPDEGPRVTLSAKQPESLAPYFISVANLERTLHEARKRGAQVVRDSFELPGLGWGAVLRDPWGNVIGICEDPAMTTRVRRRHYFLILLEAGPRAGESEKFERPHEEFMERLQKLNQLALGGSYEDGTGGFYLMTARSQGEAEAVAGEDPYVVNGVAHATVRPVFYRRDLLNRSVL